MQTKKQIRDQYKTTIQPMGVYKFTNTQNGKFLIGSSPMVDKVKNSILFKLNRNIFPNKALQADFSQQGESVFQFEVIDYLKPKDTPGHDYTDNLETLEQIYIDKLKPQYNQ